MLVRCYWCMDEYIWVWFRFETTRVSSKCVCQCMVSLFLSLREFEVCCWLCVHKCEGCLTGLCDVFVGVLWTNVCGCVWGEVLCLLVSVWSECVSVCESVCVWLVSVKYVVDFVWESVKCVECDCLCMREHIFENVRGLWRARGWIECMVVGVRVCVHVCAYVCQF